MPPRYFSLFDRFSQAAQSSDSGTQEERPWQSGVQDEQLQLQDDRLETACNGLRRHGSVHESPRESAGYREESKIRIAADLYERSPEQDAPQKRHQAEGRRDTTAPERGQTERRRDWAGPRRDPAIQESHLEVQQGQQADF
ncbi:hypothetical protein KCU77_g3252, partial [Aureobasidium melanogenum]